MCSFRVIPVFLIACSLIFCCLSQADIFPELKEMQTKYLGNPAKTEAVNFPETNYKRNSVRSSLTNNTFDFVIYEDYPRFDKFDLCFGYIFDNYMCWIQKYGSILAQCYVTNNQECMIIIQEWLDKARSLLYMQERLTLLPYIFPADFKYPATALYIASSRAFSTDISSSGTAGLWSCYVEQLVKEYEDIRDQTEKKEFLYKEGKLITLYSGIQNSYVYGIVNDQGSLNVEVGQNLTVSGYLSTTTELSVAISFGVSGTSYSYFPVMMFIEPLANKSKAAALDVAIRPNGQYEVLFPTNVKYEITNIFAWGDARMDPQVRQYGFEYQIMVKELPIEKIQTVKSGSDPDKGDYECVIDQSSASKTNNSDICLCAASRAWLHIIPLVFIALFLCL